MNVCDDRVDRVGNLISCFGWYAWYILRRLTKILFLPSMSKSLQFTSPISIISLSSALGILVKSLSPQLFGSHFFGTHFFAITIKGLVHFCFTSMHNNSAIFVLMSVRDCFSNIECHTFTMTVFLVPQKQETLHSYLVVSYCII